MDWLGLILEIMKWSRLGNGLNFRFVNSLIVYSIHHFAGYMDHNSRDENNEGQAHLELPLFDLDTLLNATNNFSSYNKLWEGGFGPVYKVRLLYFGFCAEDKLQVNKTL